MPRTHLSEVRAVIFNKPFGRYRLVKKLATGGMAEVFLAVRRGPQSFERLVALKSIHPHVNDNPTHVEMVYNEARGGGLFRHPNLIGVFDAEPIEGRHTMAMEFVPGATLEELAMRLEHSKKSLDPAYAVAIVSAASLGLHHAHTTRDLDGRALQLVHRDVSPQNIMLGHDGSVRVFDFGVAVASAKGQAGEMAGKTAYMSPEQCRGRGVDARSDIFALGIVLYELLTGTRLFKRENHIKAIRAITEEDVAPPSTVRPELPAELDAIVMKALARSLDERFPTALELHRALAAWLADQKRLVEQEELAMLAKEHFGNEINELQSVVQKALMAPDQSDTTIDLSTFDPRNARGPLSGATGAIMTDEGAGIDKIAMPTQAAGAAPVMFPQATTAMAAELQRARRTSMILSIVAVLAIVAAAAAFVLTRRAPEPPPVVEVAVAPTVVQVPLETEPPGATITLNGMLLGATTPTSVPLPSGSAAEVVFAFDGYRSATVSVTPDAAAPAPVRAALEIDPDSESAPIGQVRLTFVPPDATVTIGDRSFATGSPLVVEGLALNRDHALRIEREGFQPHSDVLRLDSADVLAYDIELGAAVASGLLTVRSTPSGAEVFVGADSYGRTPLENAPVPAGSYTLSVRASGYARWVRTIDVASSVPTEVDARLSRVDGDSAPAEPDSEPAGEDDGGDEEPGTEPAVEPTPEPEPAPAPDAGRTYRPL
jgi:serine/threonine-protein kinase